MSSPRNPRAASMSSPNALAASRTLDRHDSFGIRTSQTSVDFRLTDTLQFQLSPECKAALDEAKKYYGLTIMRHSDIIKLLNLPKDILAKIVLGKFLKQPKNFYSMPHQCRLLLQLRLPILENALQRKEEIIQSIQESKAQLCSLNQELANLKKATCAVQDRITQVKAIKECGISSLTYFERTKKEEAELAQLCSLNQELANLTEATWAVQDRITQVKAINKCDISSLTYFERTKKEEAELCSVADWLGKDDAPILEHATARNAQDLLRLHHVDDVKELGSTTGPDGVLSCLDHLRILDRLGWPRSYFMKEVLGVPMSLNPQNDTLESQQERLAMYLDLDLDLASAQEMETAVQNVESQIEEEDSSDTKDTKRKRCQGYEEFLENEQGKRRRRET